MQRMELANRVEQDLILSFKQNGVPKEAVEAFRKIANSQKRLRTLQVMAQAVQQAVLDEFTNLEGLAQNYCMARALIHQLPAEALLEIFQWYTEDEPVHIPWDFCQSPMTVSHVCSRWRNLAINQPKLWTKMLIELDDNNSGFANMFRTVIDRARGRPFSIVCRGTRLPNWIFDLRDELVCHTYLIKSFDLIWRGTTRQTPVEITGLYDLNYSKLFAPIIYPSLSRLTRFALTGVEVSVPSLQALLQSFSSIKELVIDPRPPTLYDDFPPGLIQLNPSIRFNLPHLTQLTLRTNPQVYRLFDLLASIEAPNLKSLALTCFDSTDIRSPGWERGLHLLIPKFSLLSSLRIDLNIQPEAFKEIVAATPHLKELVVPWTIILWPFLACRTDGDMDLPHLTRLVFSGWSRLGAYLDMLERRGAQTARNRERLQDVIIIWDRDRETEFLLVKEMLTRVERLCEGGMRVRLKKWEEIDREEDLRLICV